MNCKLSSAQFNTTTDLHRSLAPAGVFMWVVLVVEILNNEFRRGRIFAVKKRLNELPRDLSDLFKDIITRDNHNMEDLLLCIQWILFANRPLNREEFYFALGSGLDPSPDTLEPWDSNYISAEDMERFVLSSSKGLAEVQTVFKTVQFIHESVRDFLLKENGIAHLWPEYADLGVFEAASQERLKRCCQFYIKVDVIAVEKQFCNLAEMGGRLHADFQSMLLRAYPFVEYSYYNILYHADAASKTVPQREFWKEVDTSSWVHFYEFSIDAHAFIEAQREISDMNIFSRPDDIFLNSATASISLARNPGWNSHRHMLGKLRLLIQDRRRPVIDPIHIAVTNNCVNLMKDLLADENCNPNKRNSARRTPLILALVKGN